jgi:hypothetical protein
MVGRIRNLFFEQDWLVKSMDGTVLVGEWSEWVIFLGMMMDDTRPGKRLHSELEAMAQSK